ncbi:MAG: hypothetical protein ACYTEE_10210 [Planctomycetota bacterium]
MLKLDISDDYLSYRRMIPFGGMDTRGREEEISVGCWAWSGETTISGLTFSLLYM